MVGGVLVERTIKEVLPALETNYGGVSYGIIPATRTFGLTFSLFMWIDPASYRIIIAIL